MAREDEILLKLIIKGQDPSEIAQLVNSTQGDLNMAMAKKLDELTDLHRKAAETQSMYTRRQSEEAAKEAVKQIEIIASIQKAQQSHYAAEEKAADKAAKEVEKAAKASEKAEKDAYKARMKDAEDHFNYVFKMAQRQEKEEARLAEAAEKAAKALAREQEIAANKATNAWRGWLEVLENVTTTMTGVVSVMQFGWQKFVQFGEEIVRDTQIYEGLHGSIDAMREATQGEVADIDLVSAKNRGFQKELKLTDEQYGLAALAAKKYADATGTDTVSALDKMIDGLATGRVKMLQSIGIMVDAKDAAHDYAHAHGLITKELTDEQKLLAIQDAAMVKIKEKTQAFGDTALTVASAIERAFASVRNAIVGTAVAIGNIKLPGIKGYSDIELERIKRADAMVKERTGRDPGNYARMLAETRKAQAEQTQSDIANYGSDYGEDSPESSTVALYAADPKKKKKGPHKYYEPFGQHGENFDDNKHKAKDETDYGPLTYIQGEERDPKEEGRILAEFMARKKQLEEVVDAAGGPLMSRLLFGPGGPKQTLDEMDAFQKATLDSTKMIAEAGQHMADALGASIAASIAGGDAHRKSIRQTTHDVLEALAAQAIGRALFETASGFAFLALGNVPSAMLAFQSAALFGAIGVGSGLASRAVGSDSTASSSSSSHSGSGISSSGGSFNTPRSSTNDTGKSSAPITVNLSVWPGGEAEAGRQVAKALGAYTRESGQSIVDLTTGKAAA